MEAADPADIIRHDTAAAADNAGYLDRCAPLCHVQRKALEAGICCPCWLASWCCEAGCIKCGAWRRRNREPSPGGADYYEQMKPQQVAMVNGRRY